MSAGGPPAGSSLVTAAERRPFSPVLGVAKLGEGRTDYYMADLGRELTMLAPRSDVEGARWMGSGAAALGLCGPVAGPVLSGVLGARHPSTGRPLLSRRRGVAGLDLTFSAPKSVSVVFALGDPDVTRDVIASHAEAVGAAVAHLERRAWAARRALDEGRGLISTDGLIAAAFTHCLSRNRDPHLHTHVVAANLVHGVDGRWSALDTRGAFAHARAAGALYEAHLRSGLSARLGVSWDWSEGRGWELAGVGPTIRAEFSSRAAEIRADAVASGHDSRAGRRVAWAATRSHKQWRSDGADLRASWARRAEATPGWRLERATAQRAVRLDEHRFAASIASCPPSGVCRRDVVAAWAGSLGQGGRVSDVEASVEHWLPAASAGLGVAERREAPAAVVAAPHLVRVLGPRPAAADLQPLWRAAAAAIDRYRARWGVEGPDPDAAHRGLGHLSPERLADHLEVRRTVVDVLARLDPGSRVRREPEGRSLAR